MLRMHHTATTTQLCPVLAADRHCAVCRQGLPEWWLVPRLAQDHARPLRRLGLLPPRAYRLRGHRCAEEARHGWQGARSSRYHRLSCCRLCLPSWFCVSCSWLLAQHSTVLIASVQRPVVCAHRRRCGENMLMRPIFYPARGRAPPASLSGCGPPPPSTMRTRQSHGCTSSAATCSRCAQSHATPHDIRDNATPHSARLHDSSALKLTTITHS